MSVLDSTNLLGLGFFWEVTSLSAPCEEPSLEGETETFEPDIFSLSTIFSCLLLLLLLLLLRCRHDLLASVSMHTAFCLVSA